MFKNLFSWLSNLRADYICDAEKFILSKNPQSLEDVEYWSRQYDRKGMREGWS